MGNIIFYSPDSTKSYLYQGIDQRFKLTFLALPVQKHLGVTSSCKNDRPEVNTVYILPVVHLFICILVKVEYNQHAGLDSCLFIIILWS